MHKKFVTKHMQTISSFLFILPFCCGLLGLLLAVILFWINKGNWLAARLLGGVVTAISIPLIENALYLTSFYQTYPFLYRLLSAASFCIGPLSYLYVRTMVTQGFRLKRTDTLFFLPAILYQLHRIPFSLLTNTEKLQVVERALQETKNVAAEPEGWLPVGWVALFRIVVGISFIIAQFVLLSKWKKQLALEPGLIEKNAENIRWLNWFTGVLIFSYALLLLETLLHLGSNITLGPIIVLTICLSVLFIAFYLFTRPVILYGMVGWILKNEALLVPTETSEEAEIKKTHLSIDDGKKYKEIIETHLKENKPFCRQGYSIRDLAQEVNLPLYQVSAFINQEYGKNFNEWINDHRFAYLQQLTQDEKDFHRYTLEALGKMAGFNSRTSYITAIKKRTGKTPSAFFKKADSEETESFSNT